MLSKICDYVPRCNLCVNVYDTNDEEKGKLGHNKAEGTKVTIKLQFNNSKGGEDLRGDIAEIEHDKAVKASSSRRFGSAVGYRESKMNDPATTYFAQRQNKMIRGSTEMTYRPYSAKTDFNGSYSRNPYAKANATNRMMSSQYLKETPSMKTLRKRPQTAVSQGVMRSTASISRFKTMESRYGVQSSMSYHSKFHANKTKKLKTKVKDLEFKGEINSHGMALFTDIPKSVYNIKVDDCDYLQGAEREFDIASGDDSGGAIQIYFPLDKQYSGSDDGATNGRYVSRQF